MEIAPFTTARLRIRDWRPDLEDPATRARLEQGLAALLSPTVLAPLPPSLALAPGPTALGDWIATRRRECHSYLLEDSAPTDLIGLCLLAPGTGAPIPSLHIGYLLRETAWGQGLASEMPTGLLAALRPFGPLRLVAGVDRGNPASARVLVKAGFCTDPGPEGDASDLYRLDLP